LTRCIIASLFFLLFQGIINDSSYNEKRNYMNETSFKELNLPREIQRAIDELGFETATEIQANAIPLIREGRDVIGRSQTGTGKTLAFGIPAIEIIDPMLQSRSVQVLIVCPTRELALQAGIEIKKLAKYKIGVSTAEIYGGAPMEAQIQKLRRANIVIGTPGRIMDHLRRRTMRLHDLKMIVLDEADEMLSMGFREDIETILQDAPEERQTILFSATMPPAIMALTKDFQQDPQLVAVNVKQATVENIEQSFYEIPTGQKMDALAALLQYHDSKRTIIFANTKKMVDEIAIKLRQSGFSVQGIHGDMKQSQRTQVMDAFKSGRITALIATDVAARGIDVNDVDFVINYDIPQNTEYYVHRIGRTGRAGKTGSAITMCCGGRQVQTLLQLARLLKVRIERRDFPNAQSMREMRMKTQMHKIEETIAQGRFDYMELTEELVKRGNSEQLIAAAALQLYFGIPKKEVEIKAVQRKRPAQANAPDMSGGYGKIKISIGKRQHIAPKHIVAAISESCSLNGRDLGKIDIYDEYSVVGVPKSSLDQVLGELCDLTVCGKSVTVSAYGDGRRPAGRRPQQKQGSKPNYQERRRRSY